MSHQITGHEFRSIALGGVAGIASAVYVSGPLTFWQLNACFACAWVLNISPCNALFRRYVSSYLIALSLAGFSLQLHLIWPQLDADFGKDISITGQVISLTQSSKVHVRFVLMTERLGTKPYHWPRPKVILSWYPDNKLMHLPKYGERWKFRIRLKQLNFQGNPDGFKHTQWLLSRQITARGWVLEGQRIDTGVHWREKLRKQLDQYLLKQNSTARGYWLALMFGDRRHVSTDQWQILAQLGLMHLFAISGLHIGMLAAWVVFLSRGINWLLIRSGFDVTSAWSAVMVVMLCTGYAALAGFSLPTQRALLLVVIWAYYHIRGWALNPLDALLITLLILGVTQPFSWLGGSFMLSFTAVSLLLLLNWRLRNLNKWLRLGLIQLGLLLLMLPLQHSLFGGISLLAWPLNILVIPFFTLMIMPGLFILSCWVVFFPWFSAGLLVYGWEIMDFCFNLLLQGLRYLHQYDSQWYTELPATEWLIASWGILLCLLILPVRPKYLLLIFPLLILWPVLHVTRPEPLWQVVFFDVGQGSATLIRQGKKAMLYDTGNRFPSGFSYANAVILPYLYRHHVQVEHMVISHGDRDHAGGAQDILQAFPNAHVMSGRDVPELANNPCKAGTSFSWGIFEVEILSGPASAIRVSHRDRNNGSCVLRLLNKGRPVLLLTGDIESAQESRLTRVAPGSLPSSIMLVPHHGSKSSSSQDFLDRVRADYAVISAGRDNRFGHPHSRVTSRYLSAGIELLSTADLGQIRLSYFEHQQQVQIESYRHDFSPFWYQRWPAKYD